MKTVFMRSGVCSFCGQSFKLTGMAMHQKACRRNKQIKNEDKKEVPDKKDIPSG